MKIVLKGVKSGTKKFIDSEGISNDNFKNTMESIIRQAKPEENVENVNKVKININSKPELVKNEAKVNVKPPVRNVTHYCRERSVEEEIAVNGVTTKSVEVEKNPSMSIDEFISTLPDEPINIIDEKEDDIIEASTEYTSPITFDESLIGSVEKIEKEEKNPVEVIDDAVNLIIDSLEKITIDAVRDDAVNRMISKIVSAIPNNEKAFKRVIEIAISIFDNAEDDDYVQVVRSEGFIKLIKRIFDLDVELEDTRRDGNDMIISQKIKATYAYNEDDIAFENEINDIRIPDVFIDSSDNKEEDKSEGYNGIEFANGIVVNAKQLFPEADSVEIIVGTDESGDYVTSKDGNIIGFNIINDCEVNSIELVSKEWVKSVSKLISDEESYTSANTLGVAQVTTEV